MTPNRCSLLVPCYNAATYLPRLWQTVVAQTVPFDEIICYDDASTDATAEVARSLGARVLRGDRNRGAACARNRLAEAASSEWIHFHDADDTLHPQYLERCWNEIAPEIDVIVCDVDWVDEKTQKLLIPRRYRHADLSENPLRSTLVNPIGMGGVLCRREKFLAVGGFNENYSCWEDGDFHLRLAEAGARFAALEIVLAYAQRHDRGVSQNQRHCQRCRLQLLHGYAQRFDASLYADLAGEAEKVASGLLLSGDRAAAAEALVLCRTLGGDPPTTRHPILGALKPYLPPLVALRLQQWVRRSR